MGATFAPLFCGIAFVCMLRLVIVWRYFEARCENSFMGNKMCITWTSNTSKGYGDLVIIRQRKSKLNGKLFRACKGKAPVAMLRGTLPFVAFNLCCAASDSSF